MPQTTITLKEYPLVVLLLLRLRLRIFRIRILRLLQSINQHHLRSRPLLGLVACHLHLCRLGGKPLPRMGRYRRRYHQ
jgi:hypothetical protein